jgi:hypothetical protein
MECFLGMSYNLLFFFSKRASAALLQLIIKPVLVSAQKIASTAFSNESLNSSSLLLSDSSNSLYLVRSSRIVIAPIMVPFCFMGTIFTLWYKTSPLFGPTLLTYLKLNFSKGFPVFYYILVFFIPSISY